MGKGDIRISNKRVELCVHDRWQSFLRLARHTWDFEKEIQVYWILNEAFESGP
jgi:hypothetical protein